MERTMNIRRMSVERARLELQDLESETTSRELTDGELAFLMELQTHLTNTAKYGDFYWG